ncbi:hypothetical protein K0U83_01430 [bacterium]|nr:hypothetical protein [bacterium]
MLSKFQDCRSTTFARGAGSPAVMVGMMDTSFTKSEKKKPSLVHRVDDKLLTVVHNVYGLFLSALECAGDDEKMVLRIDNSADDILSPVRIPGSLAIPCLELGEKGALLSAVSSRAPGNNVHAGKLTIDVEAFYRLFHDGPADLVHRVTTVLVHPFRFLSGPLIESELTAMQVISPDDDLRSELLKHCDLAYCDLVEVLGTKEDDEFDRVTVVYQLLNGPDIAIEVV